MNPLAIPMFSQKKLNTYSVESPCERLPRVARYARQPWAIKRTTPTALCGYNIRNGGFIHGNAGIISTALYRCNIRNYGFIHGNADIIFTVLHCRNIRNDGFTHGNADIISTALRFFNFISCQKEERRRGSS